MAGPYAYLGVGGPTLPYPGLHVTLRSGGVTVKELARIDSGSCITTITQKVVTRLTLQKIGEIQAVGALSGDRDERMIPLYHADLELFNTTFSQHPIYLIPRPYMLIGRDILNLYKLILDGRNLEFTIE